MNTENDKQEESLFVTGKKVWVHVRNNGSSDQDISYYVLTEDLQKEIDGWHNNNRGMHPHACFNHAVMSILKLNLDEEDCPDPHPHYMWFSSFKKTFDFIRNNNLDLVGSQW